MQATDGVATSETLTTTQGDRSSVSSTFQEKPQRFQVLHEISLGVLMVREIEWDGMGWDGEVTD